MRHFSFHALLPSVVVVTLWLGLPAPAGADVSIAVSGGGDALEENVRALLRLAGEPCDASKLRVRQLFAGVEEDVRPALQALGYYDGVVTKDLDLTGKCWQATIRIDPGKPVRVKQLDINIEGDGAGDPSFTALRGQLPLAVGDVVHHGHYETIKTRLRDLALQRGYFDARLTRHTLLINRAERTADIRIDFATGRRYRFGDLRLGEQPLREAFVRRLAAYQPDAFYEAGTLADLDRNLSNAGYYRNVEVRPRRDEAADGRIPVEVNFTPEARHSWRTGIGYATDSGPRLSFGYDNRFVNDRGHRFSSDLRLSPVISTLSADYQIPGKDPHKQRYKLSGAVEHEDTDTARSDSLQLGAFDDRRVGGWNRSRFVKVLTEQSTVGNQHIDSSFLLPGIGWDRTEADNPLRTERGYRLALEFQGAHEALFSSTSLLQIKAGAKGIYGLEGWGRVTGRMDLGVTLVDRFGDLPASLRFFAGGDNSVRGYQYKSLGPKDSSGEVVGGRNLLTTSLEYEHPLWSEDWWGGVFVDAGNAFDTDDIRIKQGYGVGLRWYSPVGRVRLDVAVPDDRSDGNWRLHFGLGVDL